MMRIVSRLLITLQQTAAQPTHATITAGASRMAIGSAVLAGGAFVAALMI